MARRRRALRAAGALLASTACAACVAYGPARPGRDGRSASAPGVVGDDGGPAVRVAVASRLRRVSLSSTAAWQLADNGGRSTLVRAGPGDEWAVDAVGALLQAVGADGAGTAARPGPFVARPLAPGALIAVGGKRYRGEVAIVRSDSGLTVVNRLPIEEYLRGVVPLEIGKRTPDEAAAIAAQAVAARSYTYMRLARDGARAYDLVATVMDQVYGGADAETPLTDSAVAATAGLVLKYGGRVVNAPYHSTCGGSTAAASEVWQSQPDEAFLRPVSDRISGTDRFYCDPSPRFRWTRTFDRAGLAAALDRYLRAYHAVPRGGVGVVRGVVVEGLTPSGRVRALAVAADRGRFTLRGNDMRFVLRPPGGEILNSTYFSVETERDRSGAVSRLALRGGGYGHGVGMCQWGAIGRARAGQDFRTILQTYYPGTTVGTVD